MNKFIKVFSTLCVACLCISGVATAGTDKAWYEDYKTATGTKLTRDFSFGFSDELSSASYDNTKDNFFQVKNELPDEMPVFAPYTDDEIASSANKIYISVDGNDLNDGTIDNPVRTMARASSIAERMNGKKGGLTIYFREGTYVEQDGIFLNKALNGDENNPTFIAAYPGEKVTITTAIDVKGSDFKIADDAVAKRKFKDTVKNKIYSVDLKKLGYDNFAEFTQETRPALYVDGVVQTIARWPNGENTGMIEYTGSDGKSGVIDVGDAIYTSAGNAYTGETGNGFEFVMSSTRPLKWENTDRIWMYGYWYKEYDKLHARVKEFNKELNSVKSYNHAKYGATYIKEKSYYFYNVMEELDVPGEWFLDYDTGILYIYPSGDLADSDIRLSFTDSDAITIRADRVVISGLDINVAGRYGVYLDRCKQSIVQKCSISCVGADGINGRSRNCGVLANKVDGTVCLYSIMRQNSFQRYEPGRNFIQNNLVQGTLQVVDDFQALVSHNLVTGPAGMGLYNLFGSESVFEYNEVVGGPNNQLDGGLMYCAAAGQGKGTHMRYNYLNRATDTIRSFPRGIYVDDMASYTYSYGNILREAMCFLHGGSNNVIYNNIIVDNNSSRPSIANADGYNNKTNGTSFRSTALSDSYRKYVGLEYSPFYNEWLSRYKDIYEYITSLQKVKYNSRKDGYDDQTDDFGEWASSPKHNYYGNNLLVNSNDYEIVKTERDFICENNVSVDYDPGFKDYKNGDFTIDIESLKKVNPAMEEIPPLDKMGPLYDDIFGITKQKMQKPKTISPVNTLDDIVQQSENILLSWGRPFGKSVYIVEVSKTPDFKELVFSTRTQKEQTTIPNLEYDTTYYWRVTSESWSPVFEEKSATSDVSVFRIGSFEEIIAASEPEYNSVKASINSLSKLYDKVKSDYESDTEGKIYKGDVVSGLNKLFDDAEAVMNGKIKIQSEIETYAKNLEKEFYRIWAEYTNPTEYDFVEKMPNESDWLITGDGKIEKNGDGFVSSTTATAMIMSKEPQLLRPNTKYKVRVKYEILGRWTAINIAQVGNNANSPTRAQSYFVCVKSDLIELQRYPIDGDWSSGVVQSVENNKTIVKPNEWFDLSYEIKYTSEGQKIIVSIDGKEYFNYTDTTNSNYTYDSIGIMIQNANGETCIAKSNAE